jgi:hypothetical protein
MSIDKDFCSYKPPENDFRRFVVFRLFATFTNGMQAYYFDKNIIQRLKND